MKTFTNTLRKSSMRYMLLFCLINCTFSAALFAQVTTSSMVGQISDENKETLIGASIIAVHTPSGTRYGTITNENGRFNLPAMRIGGPYQVTVTYTGYQDQVRDNIFLSLGTAATLNLTLQSQAIEIEAVEVIADRNDVFSSDRTGAATNVTTQQLNSFPTLSRNFIDFAKLTPQASGASFGTSFGGQSNLLNNITVDGSLFNNSFGLTGEPGGRTGTSPISLDAIEEVQINLAPFDVRQAGFVGAGINAVTRSGTNEFAGSAFYNFRNESLTGINAGATKFNRDLIPFENSQVGFRLGGPIIKNKLFFFVSGELERNSTPFLLSPNTGNETVQGNTTRVLRSDLDAVSAFLQDNFGYATGPYQGYDLKISGDKFLAKIDWNISDNHKLSARYTSLDSERDQPISGSNSLGFGNRSTNTFGSALSYQNSNYIQFEKIQSGIIELNSIFGSKISNNLIVGYTSQNEDRGSRGAFFPLIEIQKENTTYISTGTEPFTPSNKLKYTTLQLQDNVSIYLNKHTVTAGLSVERLEFENVFFPGSQGVFVYDSLPKFYADLTAFKDNPNRTTFPDTLRRFQYRYSALPGGAEPVQPTKVTYAGIYLQDEWAVSSRFNLTAGVRVDIPFFDKTGFRNPQVDTLVFRDGEYDPLRVSTDKLPDAKPLFSPRIGFNFDVLGNKTLQLRGGTGIFTGRPAFVWISNQIGNNGVLTGFEDIQRTPLRPFTTDPGRFVTNAAAPSSYELALTDKDFKFPQVWRSNIAIDKRLPWNIVGTLEFIYSQDVNGISYLNINQEAAKLTFAGPDNRPRFPGVGVTGARLNDSIRINNNVVNAIYLTNQNEGSAYTITASLEKKFSNGLFTRFAYNFGEAMNLVDPGSIASGSWNGITSTRGNNDPDLAFTNNDQRHRVLGAISYRIEYLKFGATQIGLFVNGATQSRFSYVYNNDMNGDGVNNNDLIYVPNNASELVFLPLTVGSGTNSVTFTPQQQIDAFNAYIAQDDYLSERRGQYAERNGAIRPWLWNADFSIAQEFFINVGGKRNTLQLRADIVNFTNLLNSDWGVADNVVNNRILNVAGVSAVPATVGQPAYRFVTTGSGSSAKLLDKTLLKSANINSDVYRIQLGVRYTFN